MKNEKNTLRGRWWFERVRKKKKKNGDKNLFFGRDSNVYTRRKFNGWQFGFARVLYYTVSDLISVAFFFFKRTRLDEFFFSPPYFLPEYLLLS